MLPSTSSHFGWRRHRCGALHGPPQQAQQVSRSLVPVVGTALSSYFLHPAALLHVPQRCARRGPRARLRAPCGRPSPSFLPALRPAVAPHTWCGRSKVAGMTNAADAPWRDSQLPPAVSLLRVHARRSLPAWCACGCSGRNAPAAAARRYSSSPPPSRLRAQRPSSGRVPAQHSRQQGWLGCLSVIP